MKQESIQGQGGDRFSSGSTGIPTKKTPTGRPRAVEPLGPGRTDGGVETGLASTCFQAWG